MRKLTPAALRYAATDRPYGPAPTMATSQLFTPSLPAPVCSIPHRNAATDARQTSKFSSFVRNATFQAASSSCGRTRSHLVYKLLIYNLRERKHGTFGAFAHDPP